MGPRGQARTIHGTSPVRGTIKQKPPYGGFCFGITKRSFI